MFQLIRFSALFFTGMALVKSGTEQAEIGAFESFLFLSGLFSFFWVSGSMNALLARAANFTSQRQALLLYNVFVFMIFLGFMAAGAILLWVSGLDYIERPAISPEYLPFVCTFTLFSAPGHLAEYVLLLQKRTAELVRYGLFVYGLQFATICIALFLGSELTTLFTILMVFAILRFLITTSLIVKLGENRLDRSELKPFLKQAIPLIIAFLLSGSAEYVDSMIVRFYLDDASFAIFRYGARELPFALILANALSSAAIPAIAENKSAGLAALRLEANRLINWMFPLSLLLLLISDPLFKLVFDSEFVLSARIFDVYLLLIIPRMLFPQTVLTASGQTRWITWSAFIEITLNVSLSLILFQYFSMLGIALATVIAYSIDKGVLLLVLQKKHKVNLTAILPVRKYLAFSLLLIAFFALKVFL